MMLPCIAPCVLPFSGHKISPSFFCFQKRYWFFADAFWWIFCLPPCVCSSKPFLQKSSLSRTFLDAFVPVPGWLELVTLSWLS